jgi:hypothetical protein
MLVAAVLATGLPSVGVGSMLAAPSPQYADANWLIANPCQGWLLQDNGSSQPQALCDGVFAGDRARINVPTPMVNTQLPEFGLVDLPVIVQLGWAPGTFAYADSRPRTITWPRNRIEGFRIELGLSPNAGSPAILAIPARQGNLAIAPLDERLRLFSRGQYPALCAASSLDDLPANLGGLELCPASSVDAQLPGGLLTGPSGDMLQRYGWNGASAFRGGWFAGWSEWASVGGSGGFDGSPAFRAEITAGWALFARVQWDYHWQQLSRTVQHCGWEYYGEPGWYWNWDHWPPICIDVTTTTWKKYCPPNNPEPGCPTLTYGRSSDWWRYIASFEAHTIRAANGSFARYIDIVILQSQPLLTGP